MAQSLFKACKNIIRNGLSGSQNVGGFDVDIEYYTQDDIDKNVLDIKRGVASACTFGDSDESKVVLVASPEITIPAGFTLTPASPKKSLVIICNTLINEGTISMTAKGPNVLPHDWYIVGKNDGYDEVIIPAYANNGLTKSSFYLAYKKGQNGKAGTLRQCGSGGTGSFGQVNSEKHFGFGATGSGYAFGGGAGSGGVSYYTGSDNPNIYYYSSDVSDIYPMQGGTGRSGYSHSASGGVGNPAGNTPSGNSSDQIRGSAQNMGVGGRLIVFCNEINNIGSIQSNGVSAKNNLTGLSVQERSYGGASGGGAVDLFYNNFIGNTPTANGGSGYGHATYSMSGSGGNGSVTLSDGTQASLWVMPNVFKPRRKKFTKDNWTYLFTEYVTRLNEGV